MPTRAIPATVLEVGMEDLYTTSIVELAPTGRETPLQHIDTTRILTTPKLAHAHVLYVRIANHTDHSIITCPTMIKADLSFICVILNVPVTWSTMVKQNRKSSLPAPLVACMG